jgi:hypothetical protein
LPGGPCTHWKAPPFHGARHFRTLALQNECAILLRLDLPLAVSLFSQLTSDGKHRMSKKASEHHKKASEHLTHAARHHGEAAKHHEAGSHEKAAHHAHLARGHIIHGRGHAEEAVKAHLEEHGKK